METIINSQRGQISSPILGPTLQIENFQLGVYQKGIDSELSFPSDFSQNNLENNHENKSQQCDTLKIGFLVKPSKSFSRRQQPQQQNIKFTDTYSQKKNEKPSILKNLIKNSLVAKFKNSLFQHSYVLQNSMKSLLQQESYLIEDVSKKKIKINEEQNNYFILFPGDKKILIWDQISLFMNLLCLWLCPILFAFNEISFLKNQLEIWIIAYLFLDILINLNRAIIDQGEIISERKIIMIQYMRKHMFKNLLSSLLWLLCFYQFNKIYFVNEIIFIIQIILLLYQTQNNYQKYNEQLYLRDSSNSIKDILSLIILIYLFAHYMACFWHYIGIKTEAIGSTWIIEKNLQDANVYIRYNYSFYWAAMTMVTVGYGDIIPQNYIEMAYVNIIMLISSVMYAYTLNSIGIILKAFNDQRQKQTYIYVDNFLRRSLILINSYMRKNNIDEAIQTRIRNCIKYQIEKEFNENFENVYKIINDLPNGLQNELNRDLQSKILRNIKILNQQFSNSSIKNLINQFKFVKYTPNDFIYHRGDTNDAYLYYIEEGEIQLIEENSKKVLAIISKGETFGEYQFFTGLQPKTSAISSGFTSVYQIKRSDFLNLIRYNQRDYEKFHNIKDTIIFSQSFSILLQNCKICRKFNHLTIECPTLTYQPNLEQRIKKAEFFSNQERNVQFVRTNEKLNVRSMHKEIQSSIKSFQKQTDYIVQYDGSSIRIDSPIMPQGEIKKRRSIQPKAENIEEFEYREKTSIQDNYMHQSGKRKKTMAQTLAAYNRDLRKRTSIKSNLNNYEIQLNPSSNELKIEQLENEGILEEFKLELQFHNIELDRIQQYQFYKQQNNIDVVIRNYDHQRKRKNTQFFMKNQIEISKYTFSLNLQSKLQKFRQLQKKICQ